MFVYSDHAATSPLKKVALNAMMPWLTETGYGNASSIYKIARDAKKMLESSRHTVAAALGASPEEIYFTSGGTESDNWALKCAVERFRTKNETPHVVTTAIEHPAVLKTVEWLKRNGCEVTFLPVNSYGQVTPEAAASAVNDRTAIVSVMAANNEIGTVLPINDIFAAVKAKNPKTICHTDAVQAAGHIRISLKNVDLLSLSGHKLGGPKGVGALYIQKKLALPPLLHGGGHERMRRSSTENVAGIAGLSAALEYCINNLEENMVKVTVLRERLKSQVLEKIPYSSFTGDPVNRLPGNASFVIECVEGETLVLALDDKGICASSGSACSSGSLDPSHVLLAIGLPHEKAHGSLRFSLDESNTSEEIDYIAEILTDAVAKRRAMSPLWNSANNMPEI